MLLYDLLQPLHVESRLIPAGYLRYPGEVGWLSGRGGEENRGEFFEVLLEARGRDDLQHPRRLRSWVPEGVGYPEHSPISTSISPSITKKSSSTFACVCGGAASAPGSRGCFTTENAPSAAEEILQIGRAHG